MVVAAIAFLLNTTESVLILKARKRWKPFEKILLSLSSADILVATATIVYYSLSIVGVTVKGRRLSAEYFIFVLLLSENYSLLHILVITIDRFMAVKNPIQHNMRMQGSLPNILITAIWGCALLSSGVVVLIAATAKSKLLLTIQSFSVALIIMGICFAFAYRHMFLVAIDHANQRSLKQKEENHHCAIKDFFFLQECKRERMMLITCCLVLSSYVICIYPVSIETLIANDVGEISIVSQVLLLSNSALNPLVYFFKGFRERRLRESRRANLLKDAITANTTSSPQITIRKEQENDLHAATGKLMTDSKI